MPEHRSARTTRTSDDRRQEHLPAVVRVVFVCTGNICRSPMAEAVFRAAVEEAGLADAVEIDSAGLDGYHVGERPDPGTLTVLERHGLDGSGQRARRFRPGETAGWDLVVVMDRGHRRELTRTGGAADGTADGKVRLLRSFDPAAGDETDVPDPWAGPQAAFEHVHDLVAAATPGLLAEVRRRLDP